MFTRPLLQIGLLLPLAILMAPKPGSAQETAARMAMYEADKRPAGAASAHAFVGTWNVLQDTGRSSTMTLLEDGSAKASDGNTGTWNYRNGKVVVTWRLYGASAEFEVGGSAKHLKGVCKANGNLTGSATAEKAR